MVLSGRYELQSKLGFVQKIATVTISPGGLVASLNAFWQVLNPDIDGSGAESASTVAPAPVFPVPGSKDAFFALSDDLFSLLYAGLTLQGAFKAECTPSGITDF